METRTEAMPAPAAPETPLRSLVIAIAGSGGDGVALIGDLLLKMAAHQGLYGMLVQSYGPQIRGGESAVVLRIGDREICYEGEDTDVLVCFRAADLKRFKGSLHLHGDSLMILEEKDQGALPEWLGTTKRPAFRHPFATWDGDVEVAGEPKNMMALALLCRALGWPESLAQQAMAERFSHKPALVERNMPVFRKAYAREDVPAFTKLVGHGVPLVVETGNEAVARGAMAAGLQFFAGYPITPSSEVMETLIDELPAAGGRIVQAEDEISALGMVVGASFGGVPSMTATSGPGLSLMTEMMGLSSMAEIPTVIVDCQRAGPATGMPSRTEQSDLFHAIYGGHGDFPRAVLGVYDVVHARDVMFRAFELAENYQLPVLVLSDAYVAQRRQIRDGITDRRDKPRRWRWTPEDGPARFAITGEQPVNAFRVPGTPGGTYLAAGIEHTEEGNPSADPGVHQKMSEKRFRKLEAIARDTRDWVRTLGDPAAKKGIVAWGSSYGMLREWIALHPEYRVFMPEILHPFPLEAFTDWRKGLTDTVSMELSYQGQFHRYLSSLTDMNAVRSLARSGGLPMSMRELAAALGVPSAERSAR
ncbi:MAG: 2-oxoacid:acceptor oxidoreductase family protein [Candidatus Eisenbacteria bacterium]